MSAYSLLVRINIPKNLREVKKDISSEKEISPAKNKTIRKSSDT